MYLDAEHTRRGLRRAVRRGLGCAVLAGALLPAAASGAQSISSTNWAGYAVLANGSRPAFKKVSGAWRVPVARCIAGRETYAAAWVGLGGFGEGARALEQAGSDADCTRSGRAVYSAWYELVPAPPVRVPVPVRPGQQLAITVTVEAHHVVIAVRNLSTGARFARRRSLRRRDVGSAEWIVEAPSACLTPGSCRTLPLTDFGETAFAGASATAHGHAGTVLDPAWSATRLELRQRGPGSAASGKAPPAGTFIVAAPSAPARRTGAFTVSWEEMSLPLASAAQDDAQTY